jgi:hypothetical protein
VLGAEWTSAEIADWDATEWKTLQRDLTGGPHARQLERLEAVDRRARQEGRRVLFVPTFYAHGRVPSAH